MLCRGLPRGHLAAKGYSRFVVKFNNYNITGDDSMFLPLSCREHLCLLAAAQDLLWNLICASNIPTVVSLFIYNSLRRNKITTVVEMQGTYFLDEDVSLLTSATKSRC